MFELYRDASNEWRWSLVSSNGRILADSGEGYQKRSGALKAIDRIRKIVADAKIIERIA